MNKIYLLILHENLIERDFVTILKGSSDKDSLISLYNEKFKELDSKYKKMNDKYHYSSFTDVNQEYLIELYVEEVDIE